MQGKNMYPNPLRITSAMRRNCIERLYLIIWTHYSSTPALQFKGDYIAICITSYV